MDPVDITAGRLHLRAWQAGDEPALLALGVDPLAQRWTSLPSPYLAEHAAAWVATTAPEGWRSGARLSWAVCDSTTSEVLAGVTLSAGGADGVRHVSCWCLPAARGHGVVPDALGAVARWAFAVLDVQRLEGRAEVGNWASRRAAEKTGFRIEGVLRGGMAHRGALVDAWIAGLLPRDPQSDTAALPAYPDRTDGVVTLRRWRSADGAEVARACTDRDTARWLPLPVPYTPQDGQAYVDELVPAEWAEGVRANVAVTDAVTGALLGAVGLGLRDGIGEIGYWTAPWARGRGVAVRAARLHASWGFEALRLPRVELLADVGNEPSQRVAVAAGFAREGVLRAARAVPRSTGRADMVLFALTPTG